MSVREALEAAVHEASVSKIPESDLALPAGLGDLHPEVLVELLHLCILALPHMEVLVLLLALLSTIRHILALALELQLSKVIASLTLLLILSRKEPFSISFLELNDKEVAFLHAQFFDLHLIA